MPSLPSKKKSAKVTELPPEVAPAEAVEWKILKVLVILLAGLFVYAPAFHGGWLWDDDQEITANAVLPDSQGLIKIWKGETGADYFPMKSTVQWLLYRVIEKDQTGWHLVNVTLHLLNALLLWKLFERLGIRQAWLGGLLFAIHPILVESVAWVSELKNTLSLPFLILSMLAYINYDEKNRMRDFILAIVLFAAAILSKTSVVMYPFVILLFCWWKRGSINLKDILRSAPFFIISLAAGLATISFQHDRAIGSETIPVGGLADRTAIAGLSLWFYTWKTLLPIDLLPIYPRWEPKTYLFLAWPALAAVLFFFWTKRTTWGRHVLLGFGFFLLNLVPILGFITMSYMRITWAADHFVYLSSIGIIGLIVAGIGAFYDKRSEKIRHYMLAAGLAVLGLLVFEAHRYAGIFANEEAMWTHTLKSNPDAWQAHSRLGKVMLEKGNNDKAFFHIGESVRLRPDLAETHNNYGAMLEKKGDMEGALRELRTAVKNAPDVAIYKINLGSLLVRMNRHKEGSEVYAELLEKNPDNPTFLCNYGVAVYFLGRVDDAIAAFEKALTINPDLRDARENLAAAKKKKAEALQQSAPSPTPGQGGLLNMDAPVKLFGN